FQTATSQRERALGMLAARSRGVHNRARQPARFGGGGSNGGYNGAVDDTFRTKIFGRLPTPKMGGPDCVCWVHPGGWDRWNAPQQVCARGFRDRGDYLDGFDFFCSCPFEQFPMPALP